MIAVLVGRAAALMGVLLAASLLIFLMMRALPGDPAIGMLTVNATAEAIEEQRRALGLHLPLHAQYLGWIGGALRGDLGRSFFFSSPVAALLAERLPVTLHLACAALLVALLLAVPAGVLSAARPGGVLDHLCRVLSLAGVSMPVFWQGLLMILLFSVVLGWLPPGGWVAPWSDPLASLAHILLPAAALGTAYAATIARMLRASMLDALGRDYVAVSRALGASEAAVVWHDALRNALVPTLAAVAFSFGYLLAGAVLTEVIFNLPGVGRLLYESILARDYPLVQGLVLANVAIFVLVNLGTDALTLLLDPRLR